METDWKLLEQLCAIHAVSGREDAVTSFVHGYIEPLVDDVTVDNLGNVVGILKGASFPYSSSKKLSTYTLLCYKTRYNSSVISIKVILLENTEIPSVKLCGFILLPFFS